jgi:hypothetical protein
VLKEWQFNILFFVGVIGAVLLMVGPSIGIKVSESPNAVMGVGAILTYILTQKKALTKTEDDETSKPKKKEGDDG